MHCFCCTLKVLSVHCEFSSARPFCGSGLSAAAADRSFARSFALRQGGVRCLAKGHSGGTKRTTTWATVAPNERKMFETRKTRDFHALLTDSRHTLIQYIILNTKEYYVHLKIVIITAISTQHSVSNDCFLRVIQNVCSYRSYGTVMGLI